MFELEMKILRRAWYTPKPPKGITVSLSVYNPEGISEKTNNTDGRSIIDSMV